MRSIEIWIEEIKTAVTLKTDFDKRNKSKLMILFLDISDYQDSNAKLKAIIFAKKSNKTGVNFRQKTWWNKSSLCLRLKTSLNLEISQYKTENFELWSYEKFQPEKKLACFLIE